MYIVIFYITNWTNKYQIQQSEWPHTAERKQSGIAMTRSFTTHHLQFASAKPLLRWFSSSWSPEWILTLLGGLFLSVAIINLASGIGLSEEPNWQLRICDCVWPTAFDIYLKCRPWSKKSRSLEMLGSRNYDTCFHVKIIQWMPK